MEHINGDLGSVVRGGNPYALGNDWPAVPTNPWPLDYGTETSFFPHFVPPPTPSSIYQCMSSYLLFPNMLSPVPAIDFHGLYKSPYDNNQLYQEPCSSPMFSSVDPQVLPCPIYTGLPDSPRSPYSYAVSTVSTEKREGPLQPHSLDVQNLPAAATTRAPNFSRNHLADRESIVQDLSTTPFSISSATIKVESCSEAIIQNSLPSSSPVRESAAPTVTSRASDDPRSPTNQESRAESVVTTANCKNQGSKRRKSQQKRVVCVPATGGTDKPTGECLPSDSWAWRKYGQKPIKGSPYPRGYYRCSSSRGCTARKQVERSRTDPSMLVITYTSDHNHPWPTHRNALAGTTRQSTLDKQNLDAAAAVPSEPSAGSCEPSDTNPLSSVINSPTMQEDQVVSPPASTMEENFRLDQDVDLDILGSNKRDDDFFAQLEELPESFVMFGRHTVDERSDDEEVSPVVDPYNLFNWSSSSFVEANPIW